MACALYQVADNVLRSRVYNPRNDNSNDPGDPFTSNTEQQQETAQSSTKSEFYSTPSATSGSTVAQDSDAGTHNELADDTTPKPNLKYPSSTTSPLSPANGFPDIASATVAANNSDAEMYKESTAETAPSYQRQVNTQESSVSGAVAPPVSPSDDVHDPTLATIVADAPVDAYNDLPEEIEPSRVDGVGMETESTSATSHSSASDSGDRGPPLPNWSIETMTDAQVSFGLSL